MKAKLQDSFSRFFSDLKILQAPGLLWFSLFLLGPLFFVLTVSILQRSTYGGLDWNFSLHSYFKVFQNVYFQIFTKSIGLAALTTFFCLAIGYPTAWAISVAPTHKRNLYIFLVAIPFLMNLIIRIYAIRLFFGFDGPVAQSLHFLGIEFDNFSLSQNQFLVLYGMITTYLPFMVFPLFTALEKFDFTLVEATYDLGANPLKVLWSVLIPNTRSGIANGCLLVFVPCLGEFIIPDLLGGAKSMLIGNLITEQFLKSRDWPFGGALSAILMILIAVSTYMIQRWGQKKNYGKG